MSKMQLRTAVDETIETIGQDFKAKFVADYGWHHFSMMVGNAAFLGLRGEAAKKHMTACATR